MKSSRPHRSRASSAAALATAGLGAGAVAMLAGTFSPWLASGAQRRNLYGSAGVVERIAGLGRPIGYVLDVLPFTGFALVLCGALWVMGRRATAGVALAVVAVLLSVIAWATLDHRSSETVRIVALGPMITFSGTGITALSLVLLFVLGRGATAEHRTGAASPESASLARSSRMELT